MRRIACFVTCLFLVIACCIPAAAAEYEYTTNPAYFWNLASSLEEYGGTIDGEPVQGAFGRILTSATSSGTMNIPLDLNEGFNRFYFGTVYNASLTDYNVGATFKMVVTLTTGATGSYTGSTLPLYSTTVDGSRIRRTGRVSISSKCTLEAGSSNTYTFTWDDIPYEKVEGNYYYFVDFALSHFTSADSSYLYIVNSYFGLSSYYNDDEYKSDMLNKLNDINAQIQEQLEQDAEQHEETKGLLGSIIDGITGIPGKIKEAFNGLIEEIKEKVVGNIKSAMDGFLEDLKDKLGILYQAPDYFVRIIESIMTTDTTNTLTFPSMVVPVAGQEYSLNEPMEYRIFPDWIPDAVYNFINLAFSIIVVIAVINFADRKWEEITSNG